MYFCGIKQCSNQYPACNTNSANRRNNNTTHLRHSYRKCCIKRVAYVCMDSNSFTRRFNDNWINSNSYLFWIDSKYLYLYSNTRFFGMYFCGIKQYSNQYPAYNTNSANHRNNNTTYLRHSNRKCCIKRIAFRIVDINKNSRGNNYKWVGNFYNSFGNSSRKYL